jgi:hypothetical protein
MPLRDSLRGATAGRSRRLGIFAIALRILGSELAQSAPLAKRLQPFAAQGVGQRCAVIALEKRADPLRRCLVELEAQLPVGE